MAPARPGGEMGGSSASWLGLTRHLWQTQETGSGERQCGIANSPGTGQGKRRARVPGGALAGELAHGSLKQQPGRCQEAQQPPPPGVRPAPVELRFHGRRTLGTRRRNPAIVRPWLWVQGGGRALPGQALPGRGCGHGFSQDWAPRKQRVPPPLFSEQHRALNSCEGFHVVRCQSQSTQPGSEENGTAATKQEPAFRIPTRVRVCGTGTLQTRAGQGLCRPGTMGPGFSWIPRPGAQGCLWLCPPALPTPAGHRHLLGLLQATKARMRQGAALTFRSHPPPPGQSQACFFGPHAHP